MKNELEHYKALYYFYLEECDAKELERTDFARKYRKAQYKINELQKLVEELKSELRENRAKD